MALFESASDMVLLAFGHRQHRRTEHAPGRRSGRRDPDSGSGRRDHGDRPQRKRSEEIEVVRRERFEMKGSGVVLHTDYEARAVRKEKYVDSRGKTVVEQKCYRDRYSGSGRRDHGDQPQRQRSEEKEVVRRQRIEMKGSGAVVHTDYEARAVRKEKYVESRGKTGVDKKCYRDRDSGSGRRDHGNQPQRKRSEEIEVVRRQHVETKGSGAVLHADYEARAVRKEKCVDSRGKMVVKQKCHLVMHREHNSVPVGNQEMKGKNTGGGREITRREHQIKRR